MKLRHSSALAATIAASTLIITNTVMAGSDGHHGSSHHATHWSYEGAGAPSHWGDLKDDYHMCKEGKSQSPIDISDTTSANLPMIKTKYKKNKLKGVVNNGHTIKVEYENGSSITVGGKKFKLLQLHFHAPSEHTIDGKPADMVAHLVHQAKDGQLGVIGVLMKKGAKNTTVQAIWDNIPKKQGKNSSKTKINVADLLPGNMAYFNYSGSLTTPPCSENVHWMVLQNPVEVSADQVAAFKAIFAKSVRPVQPLHHRTVKGN